MRIRIDDDFDSELEEKYRVLDDEIAVKSSSYAQGNGPIIDVTASDVIDYDKEEEKNTSIEIKRENDFQVNANKKIKHKDHTKVKNTAKNKNIKGKIEVTSKLGDMNGKPISDAKINLYILNGISPKLIDSKITDEYGEVIFDNLENGSYRVIAIVNRKYFEKPSYITWNEVTISDELKKESIIVVNKVKAH